MQQLDNFRGVRQIIGRSEQESNSERQCLIDDARWQEGLHMLSDYELSFDLQLIPTQMLAITKILEKTPKLLVALCHCGSPWFLQYGMNMDGSYKDQKGWLLWKNGLKALADLPNVHCKISGLSMFGQKWNPLHITPVINAVIDLFGPKRCFFGSNFPVDKLYVDYVTIWWLYLNVLNKRNPKLSKEDKRRFFSQNCAEFYQI